jgi:hypothetical protein
VGDFEVAAPAVMESSLKYHPYEIENLTWRYFCVRTPHLDTLSKESYSMTGAESENDQSLG